MTDSTIRIPKCFYDDHCDRDLEAPKVIRETSRHYFIDGRDTDELRELLSDAKHYSTEMEFVDEFSYLLGIVTSAKATAKAITAHLGEQS